MDLRELNRLQAEAEKLDLEAAYLNSAMSSLQGFIEQGTGIFQVLKLLESNPNGKPGEAFFEVLEECRSELLQLTELRLAAKAREKKISAAHKRAVIHASIIDLEIKTK